MTRHDPSQINGKCVVGCSEADFRGFLQHVGAPPAGPP